MVVRQIFYHYVHLDLFPHALDGSRTILECYNDGRLVNHGSITLKLQQYTNKSFQDHQFLL